MTRFWILLAAWLTLSWCASIPKEKDFWNSTSAQVTDILSHKESNSQNRILYTEPLSQTFPKSTKELLWNVRKVRPLLWFREFCEREKRSPLCKDSYEDNKGYISLEKYFSSISKIHAFVNTQIIPTNDIERYKKEEFWESLAWKEDWRWDCDKYVLTKIDMLLHQWIPLKAMRPVAVMRYNEQIKAYEGHLTLIIFTNRWVLILDNLQNDIFIGLKIDDILQDKTLWYTKIMQIPSDEQPNIWVKRS